MNRPSYEQYAAYQAADFLQDLSFQRWAQGEPNPFWENIHQIYPEKQEALREARELVQQFSRPEPSLPPAYTEAQLAAVYARIAQRTRTASPPLPYYRTRFFRYAAAVSLVLLAGIAGYFYYQTTAYPVYQTAYQETQTIRLADGTRVTLNAHSRLRVAPRLAHAAVREVWLEGEAFFAVSPSVRQRERQRFVVHTSTLDVEVLGTVFNVKSRPGDAEVLLQEGSVKIVRPATQEQLLMAPGEVATVGRADQKISKKPAASEKLAWRNDAFDFRQAPLATVAQQVYHYYGKSIRFDDPAMVDYRFTARVPRRDLPLLLSLVEAAFSVRATVSDTTITLTRAP